MVFAANFLLADIELADSHPRTSEMPILAYAEFAANFLFDVVELAESHPRVEFEPILAEVPLVAKAFAVVSVQQQRLPLISSRALLFVLLRLASAG